MSIAPQAGSIKTFALICGAGLFLVAANQHSETLEQVSHRDRLYDIEIQGKQVFVTGYPGLMLHSTDGGLSWASLASGTDEALFGIDINSKGQGLIVGRSGLLMVTNDGGSHWERKYIGVKEHLFDVAISEGGKAWVVGHFGTIMHSPNGVDSWSKQDYDASLVSTLPGEEVLGGISKAEIENEGAVVEARLNSVSFIDEQFGWIVGEFGLILHTKDGGQLWSRQRSPIGKLLFDVQAISRDHVVVVGSEGTIMETHDGGLHWKALSSGTSENLLGIDAIGGTFFVIGTNGTVLVKRAKESFQPVKMNLYTWINSVRFMDSRRGFICGGRGHLLKTVDAGATWQRVSGR